MAVARKVAKDRVITVVDPEARHAHKTVSRPAGRVQGAPWWSSPDTGLVTGCELTKATGPQAADGTVGVDLLARDDSVTEPVEVLGDSACGTGQALDELDKAGHVPLGKPWPTEPTVPGGLNNDDFAVDENADAVTCPNGTVRPISPKRSVTFGAACRDCPLRQRCTTAKDGRWSNASSPGWSPAATARSATAASPRTTPGSTPAPPR